MGESDRGDAPVRRLRARAAEAGRAGLVALLSVALLLGAGAYAAYDAGLLDRFLDEPGPIAPAAVPPPQGVRLPPAGPALPVLDSSFAAGSTPAARRVRRHVAANLRDDDYGRHLGVLVQPLGGEQDLLRVGGSDLFTPASTLKLLTSAAALELMGPQRRFETVVRRGADKRSIVIVGGGDPLLTRRPPSDDVYPRPATLRALARQTARTLQRDGVARVRLGYDATLFRGPAVNPHWEPSYVPDNVVSPITALWVDGGRERTGLAARSADPALSGATEFAAELERAGVTVRGKPRPTKASPQREIVAEVQSPTLAQIVQYLIEVSDNETTEVVLRHAAIASGRRGTSANGTTAVRTTLSRLGVDMQRARIYDGSGLSRKNRLSLDMLAQTLQLAASPDHPKLRRVVSGLPVAGFNGSLEQRFITMGTEGHGLVRAKTGTLSGVHALAGVAADHEGTPLVFVAVADRVRLIDTLDARASLDGLSALLATCC